MDAANDISNDGKASRCAAVLLVGPTGSGKTPLGEILEQRGLWGRRCVHFDFGACLRACVAGEGRSAGLEDEQRAQVARMLESGALLSDEQFRVAENVFRWFLADRRVDPEMLVVLNGLPRHAGQARDMDRIVRMEAVVCLSCPPRVVRERLRMNVGGDRAGRTDDDAEAVKRKMAIFRNGTEPLLAFYRDRGIPVVTIEVAVGTTAPAMWQAVNESLPRRLGQRAARAPSSHTRPSADDADPARS